MGDGADDATVLRALDLLAEHGLKWTRYSGSWWGNREADASQGTVDLRLPTDSSLASFAYRFRRGLQPRDLPHVVHEVRLAAQRRTAMTANEPEVHPLLVLDHVSRSLDAELIRHGIQFVDASGNASLDVRGFRLRVAGRPRLPTERRPRTGDLRQQGLRLLFEVLRDPAILRGTQRSIAERCEISLGGVNRLLKDLAFREILIQTSAGTHKLIDAEAALATFERGWARPLRHALLLRRCRSIEKGGIDGLLSRWRTSATDLDLRLGGEAAGALWSGLLHPTTACIHVPLGAGSLDELLASVSERLRLARSDDGEIAILAGFGAEAAGAERIDGIALADPILARAEMLTITDSRVSETAEWVLDHKIRPRWS